jgi:hypothetical protein
VTSRRLAVWLVVLVVLFVAVVGIGEVVLRPANAVGSPAHSRLRAVEDVFPPRHLTVGDIRRGGPTCLQGATLVVAAGNGCTFIVPNGVHVLVFRRVLGSPSMMMTLTQTVDLTQTIDTGQPGPDPNDPMRLRLAVVHNGTTVTLFSCQGPGSCRLEVSR